MRGVRVPFGMLAALAYLARPATRNDLPGELATSAFEDAFGREITQGLQGAGFVSKGRAPDAVPDRVISLYAEWLRSDDIRRALAFREGTLEEHGRRHVVDHSRFYAITSEGWAALCAAIDEGEITFMRPQWSCAR